MVLPLVYAACIAEAPIVKAACGLPVTVTGTVKPISTVMLSAAPYVSPPAGALVIETELTVGIVALLPSTLWLPESAMACWPSPSVAAVPPPP